MSSDRDGPREVSELCLVDLQADKAILRCRNFLCSNVRFPRAKYAFGSDGPTKRLLSHNGAS